MMITLEDDKSKVEDALDLGIRHYLVKPFNAQMFDDKIHQVMLQPAAESLDK